MIFTDRVARGIASGKVTRVFRRWAAPRVRVGTKLHTKAGVVEIVSVDRVDTKDISDDDARAAGEQSLAALSATLRGTELDPVFRIEVRYTGPDERIELSDRADLSELEVGEISSALERLDRASRRGAWTTAVLVAVADNQGCRAAELATLLGREKESLKLDVRKLKNLGLTRSLDVGYEISSRGATYLRTIRSRSPA
ncbi:hypothetical protein CH275_09630 [Rhodococcus sp. 06-235-1A]|uniref:hypothetical protein n=1 Tax=Rhodococcus sp. 06-235-1A TaxID=2022508 RepID=UPI000B9AC893|nr:hypothetical protein [Rhodococcus sp. 06-235-1A]OZD06470.1 hypothetical protein CH275_09630 [Rhodococcus sp. 06-235-1A]